MNVTDYQKYYQANAQLLQTIEQMNLLLAQRFVDLTKVLDYIVTLYEGKSAIEEDLEVIFEVGFVFFFQQLEDLKIFFEDYLSSDYQLLKKYDLFIHYGLYLDDVYQVLQDKGYIKEEQKKVFLHIHTQIEDILKEKKEADESLLDTFNLQLELSVGETKDVVTTLEIYEQIIEELAL